MHALRNNLIEALEWLMVFHLDVLILSGVLKKEKTGIRLKLKHLH